MGVGKYSNPKSYRLGYAKPRTENEVPELPKEAERVDPVSYIRCWDKYNHGQPVDITKAKPGTRADLMAADPRDIELMLQYGIPQKQIAQIFNTPYGSITSIFKRMGVNTKVELIVRQTEAAPEELPQSNPLPEPAVPDEIWFTEPRTYHSALGTLVIVKKNRIMLTAEFGSQIHSEYVQFGLTQENRLKVKSANSGFKFHKHKIDSAHKTVCCADLINELQRRGVALPAIFDMKFDESSGMWEGALRDATDAK